MGLVDLGPARHYGEHELLPELLDEAVPEGYNWNKTVLRGKKWVKMARAFMLRTERTPRDRYNQAAHEVAAEIGRTAETVKSALRRETFGDAAGVDKPRRVLLDVERLVEARDDVTLEDILLAHRTSATD